MRRIHASQVWWEEVGYPYIPYPVPWWPYYPWAYSLVYLPGYTRHADLKVDVMAVPTAATRCDGEEA